MTKEAIKCFLDSGPGHIWEALSRDAEGTWLIENMTFTDELNKPAFFGGSTGKIAVPL